MRGWVAPEPLFRPFELNRARIALGTDDSSRARTVALVREALLRGDDWFTDGAVALASVAAEVSLLQMGGADGLQADTADAGLTRIVSALSRHFTAGRADKERASNVVVLSAVALTQRGLNVTVALRELARARRAQGLGAVAGADPSRSAAALATLPTGIYGPIIDTLAPLAAEVMVARDRIAGIEAAEAAAARAAALSEAERADLATRVSELAELVTMREAEIRALTEELKSLRFTAGHEVHSAQGAFDAFLNGPMNTLVEDALTLVEEGPDHIGAVREKLEDMQDEMRRAAQ